MSDLPALLDRLRAAPGPDRELDFAIFRIIRPEYAGPEWQPYGGGLRHVNDSSDMRCLPPAAATPGRYTASVDAALTLVPEGWMATIDHFCLSPDKSAADQWRVWLKQITDDDRIRKVVAVASTPALALCIAALEARRAGCGA